MNSELFVTRIAINDGLSNNIYPGSLPVVKNLYKIGGLDFHSPVTFFVGENGIGKSTLIEAIAVSLGFNAEGGTVNFNFSTRSSHSQLYEYLSVIRSFKQRKDGFFLRAESFYNVATNIEELDRGPMGNKIINSYGGVSMHDQSHGESFMSLVENRFGGDGIYILDEPEAALSPNKLLRLMVLIDELVKKGSQFIISTHSPILMAFPNSEVYELTEKSIKSVYYKDTEHFKTTKQFIEAPERMLKYLIGD